MVWGNLLGAAAGIFTGVNAANKQKEAMDKAIEANMAGFNLSKPYLEKLYRGAGSAYTDYLNKGPYQGVTLADPNRFATGAYNKIGGMSGGLMDNAFNMANTGAGFGSNYQNLYNKAMDGGALNEASQYALANKDALVDAAMRDDVRTLQEDTLTGINKAASGSGNVNSSRAGVADALANRAVDDRRGYLDTVVQKDLRNQYLGQYNTDAKAAMAANAGLANAFGTGMGAIGTAADYGTGAGNALSAYEQAKLNDAKNKYNEALNFNFNALNNFGGVMSGAPTSVSGIQPNNVDPFAAGVGGAMAGWGAGGKFGNWMQNQPWMNRPYSNQNMFGYGV